jgi:hypothetical protein
VRQGAEPLPSLCPAVERRQLALAGVGESMAPAVLAFALLTVVWLLVALGLRREA